MAAKESLVKFYFSLGLSHNEILGCLAHINNRILSMRTLRRILKKTKLFRRKYYSDILDVALFLIQEQKRYKKLHGYKFMHLQCIQNDLVVTQETVRLLLKITDPVGVAYRKRHRLRRRQYFNRGPNFMWHMDSYDKLKPYGICINGAIDGYSRFIMWLKAYNTSSNPRVIAKYYMETVRAIGGCPTKIRSDFGTENGHGQQMQEAMRYDHHDPSARSCFIYGSSNHNQRIESWWAFLRSHQSQYWMNLFRGLKDEDQFVGDFLDKSVVQFVFMNLIQKELDEVSQLWNCHRIRPTRNQIASCGRYMVMYMLPHLYQAENCLCPVTENDLRPCEQECLTIGPHTCDETFFELCCLIMKEQGFSSPLNPDDGISLYKTLRRIIRLQL